MLRPQVKTFLSVCDTGSFSKAAAALYLTPSAVLQQIRTLEAELGTELFQRSTRGVSLTPAGEYLERRCRALSQISEEIHRDISAFADEENPICIGTSIMERVRLLYDLWVLFSEEEEKACTIRMTNIDIGHNIPADTDLIESVNSGIPWMRDWEFLEICRTSFGFAVTRDHPLAAKERFSLADLKGWTVTTLEEGSCDAIVRLIALLRREGIRVIQPERNNTNPLWESAFSRNVLLVPECWSDILINMVVIPFEFEFSLPYGIFYRKNPQPAVKRFLDFIAATYREGNTRGIVPVLN